MQQTTLSVALEVKPDSRERLTALLDDLRGRSPYADLHARVPRLHFLSLSVFPGYDYDPLFVLEANFDGPPLPFWSDLDALLGDDLRTAIRCCKPPRDNDRPTYDAVVNGQAPPGRYLKLRTLRPSVFHHGNRGLTRDRILDERALFLATRGSIGADERRYRALDPVGMHGALRTALLPVFGWLAAPGARRIPLAQNIADWARLIALVLALVFALSLPGLLLKGALPWPWFAAICAALFLLFAGVLWRTGAPLEGTGTPNRFSFRQFVLRSVLLPALGAMAAYVLLVALLVATGAALLLGADWGNSFVAAARWAAWGAASIVVVVAGIAVWLRILERRDSAQDAPPVDPQLLRDMAVREDWVPQNHMGSIVLIKPGVLRALVVRVGHLALHLLLRVRPRSRQGYLGSMRTIHFAHWARVNNDSRLMFFSNFDQTWESYLDDFIEKAHAGLTLAWSCSVGFPPTRFLVKDGASHGFQFKEWARHSMAVSRFWYSAYPDLTTDQIERNHRLAEGLRKPSLSGEAAAIWARDL